MKRVLWRFRLLSYLVVAVGFAAVLVFLGFDLVSSSGMRFILTGVVIALTGLLLIAAVLIRGLRGKSEDLQKPRQSSLQVWLGRRILLLNIGLGVIYGMILVDFMTTNPAAKSLLAWAFILSLSVVVVLVFILTLPSSISVWNRARQ